ncbi:hypothetical protein LCGC14_0651960 [marine sediment metagenome]|uniref:Uncharacterized protein n=1 Tax=marine sediment metagenome TaxID=412755 RepID=A0A0F9U4E1_9ZZZZ
MVFIIDVRPVEIRRLQMRIDQDRRRQAKKIKVPRKVERGIQRNPVPRNKFQID